MNIKLINMPFAHMVLPSIALTQLKSVLDNTFGHRVTVDILYLNHDFANYLGNSLYLYMADSDDSLNYLLGDWFFRQTAFPNLSDNSDLYFLRYFPDKTPKDEALKLLIKSKRDGLGPFMSDLITKYQLIQADIVGLTSMFQQNTACFSIARLLKERNSKIPIIMGGSNCEAPMGRQIVKNLPQIDYVFSGPGLKSLPEFVKYMMDGEKEKCHDISGVFSKRNHAFLTGKMAIGEELNIEEPVDLDYLPFIELFEKNFPDGQLEPTLLFETSRGCWWGERAHCTFCGLNGSSMPYRAMKPESALRLFDSLFQFSGRVKRLQAIDNILPKNYLQDVLPKLKTPPNMFIFYDVKADLNEEQVKVLANARVKLMQPGIESLATSTLKLMKKGTTVFQNLALLKNCALYNVYPCWNLLIGFPGEEEDVYQKYINDMPLLTHLPPPQSLGAIHFDRYSPYFDRAKEYQLELEPKEFYELIYPFTKETLVDLAYYFSDKNIYARYFESTLKEWKGRIQEILTPWQSRWNAASDEIPPRLYFKDNRSVPMVYDTRSGAIIEHQVSITAKTMLDELLEPRRIEDLVKRMKDVEPGVIEEELMGLQDKGLIFHENGRYLSLVLMRMPLTKEAFGYELEDQLNTDKRAADVQGPSNYCDMNLITVEHLK